MVVQRLKNTPIVSFELVVPPLHGKRMFQMRIIVDFSVINISYRTTHNKWLVAEKKIKANLAGLQGLPLLLLPMHCSVQWCQRSWSQRSYNLWLLLLLLREASGEPETGKRRGRGAWPTAAANAVTAWTDKGDGGDGIAVIRSKFKNSFCKLNFSPSIRPQMKNFW